MKYFQQVEVTTARFTALLSAMIIYAICGSPSPDNPGLPEILIGVFLVMAVGFPALARMFVFDPARPAWQSAGSLFLSYGLIVVLIAGVLHGNETKLILRDLSPFLFLFLPLLAGDILEKRPDYFQVFVAVFVFMGLAFALRGLNETPYFNPHLNQDTRELYYFANAPSVLFAAVYPAGRALEKYLKTLSLRSAGVLILAAGLTSLPLLAMIFTLQRASIGWAVLALMIFAAIGLWKTPLRMIGLMPFAGIIFWFQREHFSMVFDMLSHKTAIYGANKRGAELEAVWQDISASSITEFFGLGWGGTFESPAVAGARINYTHSFVSGMLLKGGLVGVMAAGAYMSGFFVSVYNLVRRDLVLTLSLAGPLVIDVFLYASYKWLDFGLLLLVIAAAPQLHRSAAYCIHKGSCADLLSSS